jgi:dethiobiotin synthetase
MKFRFPDRFFVTGTDTGVGKTLVCALLAAGLGAHYWKPVQSGAKDGLDSTAVRKMAGLDKTRVVPETYMFSEALSPHLAAGIEGARIDIDRFSLSRKPDLLIIEGAGGVMVPLNENTLIIDLIKKLSVPVLIVACNRLGVINHTLLTVEALKAAGISILGVILNQGINYDHARSIEHYANTPVLAQVENLEFATPQTLKEKFNELFL